MRAISEKRRLIEEQQHRHKVRRGFLWALHWENLPWLELCVGQLLKWTGLWRRGFANVLNVQVQGRTLRLKRLPEVFDGFRILWISDIHVDPLDGLVEHIARLTETVDYDVCVLGGDYCFDHEMTDEAVARMQVLTGALVGRSAVYAILGNHDPYAMGQVLEDAGVRVLVNEHVRLDRNGQSLWLIGVDDAHYYGADDLDAAMVGVPDEAFKILLFHTPEGYSKGAAAGVDLYLAGHTHGGQVCLPNGFAPVTCASIPRRMIKGLWEHDGMTGYTSRGAGASGLPVRFNCPGEVALLTLKKGL
jgi:predicted MPP superfamily phosphohydrolase